MSPTSSPGRLGRWAALGLLSAVLPAGCSSPLRATLPGSGGSAGASAWGGSVGTGGFQPATINPGLGGRPATGGAPGTGGVRGFGGSSSAGGAVSTGGAPSTATTECTAGRCLVTLASGRERIWPGIAVDGANVYWTEHNAAIPMFSFDGDGRVMRVSKDGGAAVMLASGQDFPSCIQVDATSLYWTNWNMGNRGEMFMQSYASVVRAPLDGTKTSAVAYVDLDYEPRVYGDIALDGTSVYWLYQGRWDLDYVDGSILRSSLADGSTTTLATDQWRPYRIAVHGSSVYWVNAGSAEQGNRRSVLMKMPVDGGAVTTLDVRASGHGAIALDAAYIYWTSGDGTVMRMSLEGGAPITMASGQSGPTDIAVDAASIYWVEGDGTIRKLPLKGGTPSALVSGQPSIQALAVDATSVYWTTLGTPKSNYQDGSVMKLTPK